MRVAVILTASLILPFLLSGCPCNCEHTPDSLIQGVVTDAVTGSPLSGVTVASDIGDTVLSDTDGAFSVHLGSKLAVIKQGYHSEIADTSSFPKNTTSTYDIVLIPGDTADTSAPPTPMPGRVTSDSFLDAQIGWFVQETTSDLAGYIVYRGNDVVELTAFEEIDVEPVTDKTYCYSVVAIDASGNESPHSGDMCWVSSAPGTSITYRIFPDLYVVSSSQIRFSLLVPPEQKNTSLTIYRDGVVINAVTAGEDLIINYTDVSLQSNTRYCYSVTLSSDGVPGWDEVCISTWP